MVGLDVESGGVGCGCGRSPGPGSSTKGEGTDQKEDERRQEARQVCRARWREELCEVLVGLPVCRHDDGWNGKTWNVWGEGWLCDDAPVTLVGVCESGVAENVSGDCDGRPVVSVMLRVSGVDVSGVGESEQSGFWENDVDHGFV